MLHIPEIAMRYLPADTARRIIPLLATLSPNDLLIAGDLAHRVACERDPIERFLFALVNGGVLGLVLRMDCTHPQTPHTLWVQSLSAYAQQAQQPCPTCLRPFNAEHARVAFRAIAPSSYVQGAESS